MNALNIIVNSSQTRVKRDRLATLVSGEDWWLQYSNNIYIEPFTLSAMLMPLPLTTNWYTSGYRYHVSDYTFATGSGSNWVDDPNTTVDNYIKGIAQSGDNSELVTTQASQPANGAMWLSWYGANAGADDMVAIECGWGTPSTAAVSLRIYAGGKVDVYRGIGGNPPTYEGTYSINGTQQSTNPQQTADAFCSVIIMPFRAREILVISNRGGGFVHLFDDIDPTQPNPLITPEAPFWWTVPTGSAKVGCAPCMFQTNGYVSGSTSYFVKPPQSGEYPNCITYQSYNGGGVSAQLSSATDPTVSFTANGSANSALLCVSLTGNGITTPNVYGAMAYFSPLTASTASTPVNITQWCTKAALEVPNNATELKWEATFKNPATITGTVPNFTSISNRPYTFSLGGFTSYGVSEPPKLQLLIDDTSSRLTVEVRDKWKLCENYLFTDPTPLDGMSLVSAFQMILSTVGIQSNEMDIEDSGFTLPQSDTPSKTDFSVLINVGDTAADWLSRLHENYCATWFMGWCPSTSGSGWTFRLCSPATLGTTSVLTLYSNVNDALNGPASIGNFPQYLYRSYDAHSLEPEANSIWVTGRDPRTGLPIVAYQEDTASQDPTTAIASQPTNWLGEVRKYALMDASISSQAALNQCVSVLFQRLTKRRVVAEFESDFLFKANGLPVWRGDVVTLEGLGDFRIKSFRCEYQQEPNNQGNNWFWRPTKYVCEAIDPNVQGMTSLYGFNLSQVVQSHKLRSRSKRIIRQDAMSQDLVNQKTLKVYTS